MTPRKPAQLRLIEPFEEGSSRTLLSAEEANRIVGVCNLIIGCEGKGIKITKSAAKLLFEVEEGAGDGTSNIDWQGQWVAGTAYAADSLVIRDTTAERDAGLVAGLYIATLAVPGSTETASEGPGTAAGATYWELIARGNWGKLVIRQDVNGAPTQDRTTIDGGDLTATNEINVGPYSDNGEVNIVAADCNGKVLAIREIETCENGLPTRRLFLCSEAYF